MAEDHMACLNCSEALNDPYCQHCGQKSISPGITFQETISDFLSTNFSIDGPIWSTLRLLVLNPGRLFREFIGGKRKSYYKPIQFFIVTTIVYLAYTELIDYDPLKGEFQQTARSENQKAFLNLGEQAARLMVKNISNFLFLLATSIALSWKMFEWKKGTLAEYLSIGFYISGIYVLFGVITSTLLTLEVGNKSLNFIVLTLHSTYAFVSYAGETSFWKIGKGLFASLLALILYLIFSFSLAYLIVWIRQ